MLNYEEMTRCQIVDMLSRGKTCVLSLCDCNQPYAVYMFYKLDCFCDNILIKMKSKSCGKKMEILRDNNKVCLNFQRQILGCVETVIIIGKAKIEEKCGCDNITIEVLEMSGRKYSIC